MENTELSREELFEVLRVKFAYERAIADLTGNRMVRFSVDETPKGRLHLEQFGRIARRLKVLGVSLDDYIAVWFRVIKWPRPVGAMRTWRYPYLRFLASDRAWEMFRERLREVEHQYCNPRVASRFIKAHHPGNYECEFKNCFYNGFPIVWGMYETQGTDFLAQSWNLFKTFFAFSDTFTPEFIITHSKFKLISEDNGALVPPDDWEVKLALMQFVERSLGRASRDARYLQNLLKSRSAVAEREKVLVESLYALKEKWSDVWSELI